MNQYTCANIAQVINCDSIKNKCSGFDEVDEGCFFLALIDEGKYLKKC